MTGTTLNPLMAELESNRLDRMSGVDLKSVGRAVAAFLNAEGGKLVLGIDEQGRVPGVNFSLDKVERYLANTVSPKAPWSVNVEWFDGKECFVIDVPVGTRKPYLFQNQVFVRHINRTVVVADQEDIAFLIGQGWAQPERWERLPAPGFSLEDLDVEEIVRTADEVRRRRFYELGDANDPLLILERLNLAQGGLILNGAVVMFGKQPARRYPQTRVRAVCFEASDRKTFLDNRVLEGNIFELIRQIDDFFRRNLRISSQTDEKSFQRVDVLDFPSFALREAVMNALAHRDYAAFDGSVSIAIYPDRIEIWNPGRLPEGLSVRNLKDCNISRPHNPDMAQVFFLRGLIERWGIGTHRIVTECLTAGLPEPFWEERGGGIRLTMPSSTAARSETRSVLNSRSREFLQSAVPGTSYNLIDYHHRFELSDRSARRDLRHMVELGYLKRTGAGMNTAYVRTAKPVPEP